jgi:hypothetical protein
VHGSAFVNAILCHPETVLIEINAPWVAKQQDDANERPATRDAIMSSMRAAGSLYYYNVYPRSLYSAVAEEGNVPPPVGQGGGKQDPSAIQRHKPHGGVMGASLYARFYTDENLVVNPDHVLTILRLHGIAASTEKANKSKIERN